MNSSLWNIFQDQHEMANLFLFVYSGEQKLCTVQKFMQKLLFIAEILKIKPYKLQISNKVKTL